MAMERQREQIFRQLRKPLGSRSFAGFEHELEPRQKTFGVEALVFSRPRAAPQIIVEDLGQLLGGGERDQLTGVFEPDVVDQPPQQRRR